MALWVHFGIMLLASVPLALSLEIGAIAMITAQVILFVVAVVLNLRGGWASTAVLLLIAYCSARLVRFLGPALRG